MKNIFLIALLPSVLFNIACNGNEKTHTRLSNAIERENQRLPIQDSSQTAQPDSSKQVLIDTENCQQIACALWAQVNLTEQQMYLYENGILIGTYKVSTGIKRRKTPTMERRFEGRMYRKYTSKKFPGGDFMGLGNMPYVVFIKGGYAIHGTTPGSFNMLGKVASHGCIRLHPDNAKIFFDLIHKVGAKNVWISVTY
jgi:lipoprotein-anchoring transpeptidase ErfK/SrfK